MAKARASKVVAEEVKPVEQEVIQTENDLKAEAASPEAVADYNSAEDTAATFTEEVHEEEAIDASIDELDYKQEISDVEEEEAPEEDAPEEDAPEEEEYEDEPKTDFTFKAEELQAYLDSYKEEDKIVQESKGGNFVSNRDHSIYVPLALFIK